MVFKIPKELESITDFFTIMAADDGIEHRSNRKSIFDPFMNQIGVGV